MIIQTLRFGSIEVKNKNQISFPEGLLGFSDLKVFVFLDDSDDEVFVWLQSCENPKIVFPVIEPELFDSSYKFNLSKYDLGVLQATSEESCYCFVIVTIPDDPIQMTANMKAPIIINVREQIGKQCVLQNTHLAIRESIFSKLQQRMVQGSPSVKRRSLNEGVAIRVPEMAKLPETGA